MLRVHFLWLRRAGAALCCSERASLWLFSSAVPSVRFLTRYDGEVSEPLEGRQGSRVSAAQLASIRLMSGQVSRGSAGEYQADERAGVAWLSWRVSGR